MPDVKPNGNFKNREDVMTKHERTWAQCQPEEKKRIDNQKCAKLDDELEHDGNPLQTAFVVVVIALIVFMGIRVFVNHKALPVASATIKA